MEATRIQNKTENSPCAYMMNVTIGDTTEDRCTAINCLSRNNVKITRRGDKGAPLCQFSNSQTNCPCYKKTTIR